MILSSQMRLKPIMLSIKIDLTSYLPADVSEEIKNDPKKAEYPYYIPKFQVENNNSFRELVEEVKSSNTVLREIIASNPVLYVYNTNLNFIEVIEDLDDRLINHYLLGKLNKDYTIKISKEECVPKKAEEVDDDTREKMRPKLPLLDEQLMNDTNFDAKPINIVGMKNNNNASLENSYDEQESKKNKIATIVTIIMCILVLLVIGVGIYFLYRILKPKIKYKDEKLIFQPNYAPNLVYRINGVNMRNITFNSNGSEINGTQTFKEYYDVVMGIFDQKEEIKNNTRYEYYNAYISVLNITFENETGKILAEYDKNISEILNQKNLRRLANLEDTSNILDNNTKPFMKLGFFKNGKIKQMYLSLNLSDITKLICKN